VFELHNLKIILLFNCVIEKYEREKKFVNSRIQKLFFTFESEF